MNTPSRDTRHQESIDDRILDRLVDGELPEADRRELLLRLSKEPGGWRRCAMAFLEAQSWQMAMDSLTTDLKRIPDLETGAAHRWPNRRRRGMRLAAFAAGLAAMFFLGWILRGGAGHNVDPKPATHSASQPMVAQDSESAAQRAAVLRPVIAEAGEPMFDPATRAWELQGYQAQRQRRLIPMELRDGRRVDVPIQEIRVQYVGNKTY